MNVGLRLMEAGVEFVWWWGLHSPFCVQPIYSVEIWLCFRLGCDNSGSRETNFSRVSTSILPNMRVSGLALKIFALVEGRTQGEGKGKAPPFLEIGYYFLLALPIRSVKRSIIIHDTWQ